MERRPGPTSCKQPEPTDRYHTDTYTEHIQNVHLEVMKPILGLPLAPNGIRSFENYALSRYQTRIYNI